MRRLVTALAIGILWHAGDACAKSKLEKWLDAHAKAPSKHSSTVTADSAKAAAIAAAPKPSTAMLDSENGFHGVPFGADQSSSYFFGAVLVNASSDFTLMSRPSDPQMIGDVRINRILWLFYQHRLEGVMFDSIGPENGAALRQGFETAYGKAAVDARAPAGFLRLHWTGKLVELVEGINADLGTVNVMVVSVPIRAQVTATWTTAPKK